MKETAEEVARAMVAEADILAMLGNQPLSSLKVVEKLKGFAERIFNANVPAAVSPANLPPVNLPTGADGTDPGGEPRMRGSEAAAILMELARHSASEAEVTALQMGARRLLARHFQHARRWLRKHAQEGGEA